MIKPEVGASNNTWGTKTNGNWDIIESKMVRQSIQWTITTGDDNSVSTGGPFLITRYGNDGLRIDDPIFISRQTGAVALPGVLLASTGSFAAPSISFAGAPDIGFYGVNYAAKQFGVAGRLVGDGTVPAGAIMDFAMPNPPAGWLTCDGQAVSRVTYAQLFANIGGTWGGGDGSTTFNLPNFQTRYRRHRDNSPSYANTVGTLQTPCNLSHYHNVIYNSSTGYTDHSIDHLHNLGGTTGPMNRSNPHSHPYTIVNQAQQKPAGTGLGAYIDTTGSNTGNTDINHEHALPATTGASDRDLNHYHSFGFNVNTGGGAGDGNETRPYSATVLTCIKT
jgi:microcystin-dependent protein